MARTTCVLLVDPDADFRALGRAMLERAGYRILEAASGTETLDLAATLRPAVILLDVRLPDLDGYEVFRQLKANPLTAPMPVVFLVGAENTALSRFAYQSGAAACLLKPVRLETLLTVLDSVRGSAAREREHTPKKWRKGG